MKLFGKRVGNGLYAWDAANQDDLERIPRGKMLLIEVTSPRKIELLRLYWTLCARIASGIGDTKERVDRTMRIETGHYDTFTGRDGTVTVVLRSIAFSSMDETEFRDFFERCVPVTYDFFGLEPEAVNDLLLPTGDPTPERMLTDGSMKPKLLTHQPKR